jgi:tetratricopeptide (TPR) repeat protein
VCIALKRYAEAVAVSARAIRLLPSDAQLHAQLGVAYYDSGNHLTAIEELKKAIELDPGFSKAHYGLAIVYAAAGQREAALQECETLKRLDPARGAELMKLVSRK